MKTLNYLYIDESGDFGKTKKSSKYLVVASIGTNFPRPLEKTAKKIWRSKPRLHGSHELHAHSADDVTRNKFLTELSKLKISIHVTKMDKHKSNKDPHLQYYVLLAKEVRRNRNAYIIIIDKRDTIKKRNQILKELGYTNLFRKVEFADSKTIKQLQAVDFVSWAAYQKYENNDDKYFNIIVDKVEPST